jgi:hypothetical protein
LEERQYVGLAVLLGRVDLALQSRNGLAAHIGKLVDEVL